MRDHQLSSSEERRRNVKLALILASVAATFFVGFIVKMSMFGHH